LFKILANTEILFDKKEKPWLFSPHPLLSSPLHFMGRGQRERDRRKHGFDEIRAHTPASLLNKIFRKRGIL